MKFILKAGCYALGQLTGKEESERSFSHSIVLESEAANLCGKRERPKQSNLDLQVYLFKFREINSIIKVFR